MELEIKTSGITPATPGLFVQWPGTRVISRYEFSEGEQLPWGFFEEIVDHCDSEYPTDKERIFNCVLRRSRRINRDLKIYDVKLNNASIETKTFFMQNKENE